MCICEDRPYNLCFLVHPWWYLFWPPQRELNLRLANPASWPTAKGCPCAGFPGGVPTPAASASLGNLFEMHIPEPHPRATLSNTLGVGPVAQVTKALKCEKHCCLTGMINPPMFVHSKPAGGSKGWLEGQEQETSWVSEPACLITPGPSSLPCHSSKLKGHRTFQLGTGSWLKFSQRSSKHIKPRIVRDAINI